MKINQITKVRCWLKEGLSICEEISPDRHQQFIESIRSTCFDDLADELATFMQEFIENELSNVAEAMLVSMMIDIANKEQEAAEQAETENEIRGNLY